jgi:hypothetical protein
MNYVINMGARHVGPFPTSQCAQYWAEIHGVDDWTLVPVDDPAEAPAELARLRQQCANNARTDTDVLVTY